MPPHASRTTCRPPSVRRRHRSPRCRGESTESSAGGTSASPETGAARNCRPTSTAGTARSWARRPGHSSIARRRSGISSPGRGSSRKGAPNPIPKWSASSSSGSPTSGSPFQPPSWSRSPRTAGAIACRTGPEVCSKASSTFVGSCNCASPRGDCWGSKTGSRATLHPRPTRSAPTTSNSAACLSSSDRGATARTAGCSRSIRWQALCASGKPRSARFRPPSVSQGPATARPCSIGKR